MTDGSTMQTSFQCAIADKKGFISSDRGGGSLSMHGMCNRLRGMQALLVEVSSLKPPCPIPPPGRRCFLHSYHTPTNK